MSKPVWRNLILTGEVLREQTPDDGRLLLWLPGREEGRARCWERIGNVPGAPVMATQGICAVQANSVPTQQRTQGLLAKLLGWLGRNSESQTWTIPNGQSAEQSGPRQTDLLLVWAEDEGSPLDETRIKTRWPKCDQIQKLGPNLFVIRGVEALPAATAYAAAHPPPPAFKQAQDLLRAARQAGDRTRETSALIDLGAVLCQGGDARAALGLLQSALKLARQLGDRPREMDALLNLGMALKTAAQTARALEAMDQALTLARQAADRYAEKLILEQIGSLHASQRNRIKAIGLYEQALVLAQALGHRPHEADLLWQLAIQHAELGQRDQALNRGQTAVALFKLLGHPNHKLFADNLEYYNGNAAGFSWAEIRRPNPIQAGQAAGAAVPGGTAAPAAQALGPVKPANGPARLRMALSVARTVAQQTGSGLPTVPAADQQQRLQTCGRCEHHTGVRCLLCGCFTSTKTRLSHETCPVGKWPR